MKNSILLIALFLVGCASVRSLDGGEKDITPPQVLKVYPDSASTNSKISTITFTFDEYIKTTKVSDLLLISPSQKTAPSVTVKGKKLLVTLNDDLLDNTTYTIQFNGSVIDNNEGNPLLNYNYIFSTGDYIDSLYYTGTAIDILTNEPLADCNIQLYKSFNDSNLLNNKPAYITRTNKQGSFNLTNLPPDSFLAVALLDKNKNLLLNEDDLVSLNTIIYPSQTEDTFYLFRNENTTNHKPVLLKSSPGIYIIKNNRHLANSNVTLIINNKPIEYLLSTTKDSIIAYYTPLKDTSDILVIIDKDSTKLIRVNILSKLSYNPKVTISTSPEYISVHTQTPIDNIDTTKINLYADSISVPYIINRVSPVTFNIIYNKYPQEIQLSEGAITDVFSNITKADTLIVRPIIINTSILKLKINTLDSNSFILQIKKGDQLIRQLPFITSRLFEFNNLPVGNYRAIIITDTNHNKIWDTGNTFTSKRPEKIQISKEFELRENWDKELIINVE